VTESALLRLISRCQLTRQSCGSHAQVPANRCDRVRLLSGGLTKTMPRFSLKDLLIGTALLAAGDTAICGIGRLPNDMSLGSGYQAITLLWFGGGTLIGAGLFIPFKRPWLGAALGLLAQAGILVAAFSH
jgi:hypothetical protein